MKTFAGEFKKYQRVGLSEMRKYVKGEDLTNITVSEDINPIEDMGMIARNAADYHDSWYVPRMFFEANYELAKDGGKI